MKECFRQRFVQSLFKIMSAAITPGIQPQKVKIRTIRKLPQPLSTIDSGGKNIARRTRIKLIAFVFSESEKKKKKSGWRSHPLILI